MALKTLNTTYDIISPNVEKLTNSHDKHLKFNAVTKMGYQFMLRLGVIRVRRPIKYLVLWVGDTWG